MTEHDWNTCTDPQPMLEFLRGKASDRKLRLFAVACCRQVWKWLTDARPRAAVRVAEQYADKKATQKQLTEVWREAKKAVVDKSQPYWRLCAFHAALNSVDTDFSSVALACENAYSVILCHPRKKVEDSRSTKENQASLLRCIFGNPFTPVSSDSQGLTSVVVSLAQAIYDEHAFDRMPILADALEEAGCTDASILEHCRSGAEHVRGCWVVDLALGKE